HAHQLHVRGLAFLGVGAVRLAVPGVSGGAGRGECSGRERKSDELGETHSFTSEELIAPPIVGRKRLRPHRKPLERGSSSYRPFTVNAGTVPEWRLSH